MQKKILSVAFFAFSACLFLMLASYNTGNAELNFFGVSGNALAEVLIEKIWGLTSFALPLVGILLAIALNNKMPIENIFWRMVFLFLSMFSLNILLLNTPVINTPYVGTFALLFHAFILHFVGSLGNPSVGSIAVELLIFATAITCLYRTLPQSWQKITHPFRFIITKKIFATIILLIKKIKTFFPKKKSVEKNSADNDAEVVGDKKSFRTTGVAKKKISHALALLIKKLLRFKTPQTAIKDENDTTISASLSLQTEEKKALLQQISTINQRANVFPFITKITKGQTSSPKHAVVLTSKMLHDFKLSHQHNLFIDKPSASVLLSTVAHSTASNLACAQASANYVDNTIDLSNAHFFSGNGNIEPAQETKTKTNTQNFQEHENNTQPLHEENDESPLHSSAILADTTSVSKDYFSDLIYPLVLNFLSDKQDDKTQQQEASHRKNLTHYYQAVKDKSQAHDTTEIDAKTVAHLKIIAEKLEKSIQEFGIEVKVVGFLRGPSITRFELTVEPGVKISRIANLSDNIALTLAATSIRIVAPIPGKSAIGIEIPNETREMVPFPNLTLTNDFKESNKILPIALGKSIFGTPIITDLENTPHLLIAGATGSGKSVCVNTIIASLMLKRSPQEVRFLMIDPKMVELNVYNGTPHLLTPTITNAKLAAKSLRWILSEMEARYAFLESHGVRNIKTYNQMVQKKGNALQYSTLPYIVIVIDEFADLMMVARKEVEDSISRLAAMSRAVGIHLILATQRPSVDVITGVIKANFPSRIAFQVPSKIDSRTILDEGGAEKLIGRGDMLFQAAGAANPERIQGAFLSDEEIHFITSSLKQNQQANYYEEILLDITNDNSKPGANNDEDNHEDNLFEQALQIVKNDNKASASYLQRKLKIGYNRAARMVETMEDKGLLGPANGMKSREILF